MVASLDRDTTVPTACGFPFLKPVAQPPQTKKPNRRIGRWLGAACAAVNACVVAGALYLSQVPKQAPVVQQPAKSEDFALFEKLDSAEYLNWAEQYQRHRAAELLAEAEETKAKASEMAVEASYKLADAILPYGPDSPIITTTVVDVSCRQNEFGWAADVVQVEKKYQDGTIGHLASCNAGRWQPGDEIGMTGKNQASIKNGL